MIELRRLVFCWEVLLWVGVGAPLDGDVEVIEMGVIVEVFRGFVVVVGVVVVTLLFVVDSFRVGCCGC